MVRTLGWTPSSRGEDPRKLLNEFVTIFDANPDGEQNYPMKRSGHRCFTDNDYFYLIGGYCTNERGSGKIIKELWAMSIATFEWRRYQIEGDFPEKLASFAIVQLSPFSKSFLIFGGSSVSFGSSSSNDLHLVRINNQECVAICQKLTVEGVAPRPMYGHAMCAGEVPGKYYIIGGTEGNVFNFDVTSVTMKLNPELDGDDQNTWHYEHISANEGYPGRYRLEAVYDEATHRLLFFGGGNAMEVFGFDRITTLDVITRKTDDIDTTPDHVHGFPESRRCHTLVRHKRNIIMTGGVSAAADPEPDPQHSDIWVFNLDDSSWKKWPYSLPKPVFFHDSAMTGDGWLLAFGGVHGLLTNAPRNNMLISACFDVPTLGRAAIESLRHSFPQMFSGLYCGNFCQSSTVEIIKTFMNEETIKEEERKIIEGGAVKFHEDEDRNRHYLNENGAKFLIPQSEPRVHPRPRFRVHIDEDIEELESPSESSTDDEDEEMGPFGRHHMFEFLLGRGARNAFNRLFPGNLAVDRDSGDDTDDEEPVIDLDEFIARHPFNNDDDPQAPAEGQQ